MPRKKEAVSTTLAARVLFHADRVCCVCRIRGKPVQIHHIDGDPSNNAVENLAVLCLDCHRDTQIQGGFDRKLDADQVVLYRDDWHRLVARQRAAYGAVADASSPEHVGDVEAITSIADIYRENEEFVLLAMLYDAIGNCELRDKYIELAIEKQPRDEAVTFLRGLQRKPELIPTDVAKRELAAHAAHGAWEQRARLYHVLGRHREAVVDYIRGIRRSLREKRIFSAAFYLKEVLQKGLVDELFVLALKEAADRGDLWWQVRALQELGWEKELNELLLQNAAEIEASEDPMLSVLLARAKGDPHQYVEARKSMARATHLEVGDS